jgi:tetratricopeptide (TPR) repeat protein
MRQHLLSLFTFVACVAPAAAAPPASWTEVRSKHFIVLTNSGEKDARRIATQFEQMSTVFHTLFPTKTSDTDPPITVLALKDKKAMQTLEPSAYLAKNQLELAGLFLRAPDKNFILVRLDAQQEHPFATVYHEYTHYLLRKADEWLPLWLNEGLAEFYQNTDIEDKDVRLGQPSQDDILYLSQNRLLPLTTLLAVDHNSPYYHDEQKGTVFYAESWALTHYLIVTDRGKGVDRLHTYTVLLAQHEDPVTAAQHAFGDLNKLQQALNSYVQQQSFSLFVLRQSFKVDESSFQVRSIPVPEVDAIRAEILIGTGREKDAQSLLDSVLHDDPKSAVAHEAMGLLKFREGDTQAAKSWYGQAVDLDSHSYLAYYYFAVLAWQAHDAGKDEAIESSLRMSIKLGPDFAPSYDALAMFYASRHRNLAEAHMLSLQSVELEPANLSYRLNGAEILAEDQQFASAINVLNAAKPLAKTPGNTNLIQARLARVVDGKDANERAQQREKEVSEASTQTAVLASQDGKTDSLNVTKPPNAPRYPTEAPTGAKHLAKGTLHDVKCSDPSVLTLSLEQPGKSVYLYSNDFYKITFSLLNYSPNGDIDPCKDIEGKKASIRYAEVSDKSIDGQILSIELSK